jgi:type I restriction enzyme S subunit
LVPLGVSRDSRVTDAEEVRKAATPPDGTQAAALPRLPPGWSWRPLREICTSVADGDHQPPPQVEDGVPFLVIGNVRSGSLNFERCRHVPLEYYQRLQPTRRPQKGDVLYTLVGSYGIPALVTDDRPFCVQRHIGILRPADRIDSAYLAAAMAGGSAFSQARRSATGTAQMTVPLSGLRKLALPIPPLSEQRRIVSELERYSTSFTKIEEAIRTLLKRAARQRASILAAAFSGTLVPQEPSDESASILLGRMNDEGPPSHTLRSRLTRNTASRHRRRMMTA